MRLWKDILPRLAAEHRKQDFIDAGVRQAYYPAPSQLVESISVLFFVLNSTPTLNNEQTWETTVRAQYLYTIAGGESVQAWNALEPLIEVISDHFDPLKQPDAYALRVPNETGNVHRCAPTSFDSSQRLFYADQEWFALVATFEIKHIRVAGT